jgi:hypothetical protein
VPAVGDGGPGTLVASRQHTVTLILLCKCNSMFDARLTFRFRRRHGSHLIFPRREVQGRSADAGLLLLVVRPSEMSSFEGVSSSDCITVPVKGDAVQLQVECERVLN